MLGKHFEHILKDIKINLIFYTTNLLRSMAEHIVHEFARSFMFSLNHGQSGAGKIGEVPGVVWTASDGAVPITNAASLSFDRRAALVGVSRRARADGHKLATAPILVATLTCLPC